MIKASDTVVEKVLLINDDAIASKFVQCECNVIKRDGDRSGAKKDTENSKAYLQTEHARLVFSVSLGFLPKQSTVRAKLPS